MHDPSHNIQVCIVEIDGDVVELAVSTPMGDISVITNMIKDGDALIFYKLHIDGPGAGSFGLRALREFAREFGRRQGAKQVNIYGSVRTTGAIPGHIPRSILIPVGDGQ